MVLAGGGLNAVALGQRLGGISGEAVRQQKDKGSASFLKWSKNKDSLGIGWEYRGSDKQYYPRIAPEDLTIDK